MPAARPVPASSLRLLVLSVAALTTFCFAACNSADEVATPGAGAPGGSGPGGSGGSGGGGPGGSGGTGGHGGGVVPGGVGTACADASECRAGLTCGAASTCEPGHATPSGSPCTISGECAAGLYCGPTHSCATAGTAASGEACVTDAFCAEGLRCAIVGVALQCAAEGAGDLGAACASSGDCRAALGCFGGVCIQPPPGTPTFGLPTFAGADCGEEAATPQAYFRVPRGDAAADGDFYRLPFPNDIRVKNGHPDLTGHPTPGPSLLGYDLVDRYLRAIEREDDGFGAYPTVILRFSAIVDIDTLRADGVVSLVDVTPGDPDAGRQLGYRWRFDNGRGKYVCGHWLGLRPSLGRALKPLHTYAVVVTTGVATTDGVAIARGEDFAPLLVDAPPADQTLLAAHSAYLPLRSYLATAAIDPATILTAAVFTVRNTRGTMEQIQAAIGARQPPVATGWVRCGDAPSPCPDVTGNRACGTAGAGFDELHALVDLPIFQQGTAPYVTEADGGGIGTPAAVVRTEQVCLSLTVPTGAAMPATGWPAVIFAHGTGGNFRSQIETGSAAALAAVDDGNGQTVRFATLGIDQVSHGPRRNGSTGSPQDLFFNFQNPAAAVGNSQQGGADQIALAKFAGALLLDAASSPTAAEIRLDPAAILFWGHSQGATHGAVGLPYAPEVGGIVLSGASAGLIHALLGKTSPVNIRAAVPFVLQDPGAAPGELAGDVYHPILSLIQQHLDPADPVDYSVLLAAAPKPGDAPRHLFQLYGIGDTYTPADAQAAFASGARLALVAHDVSVSTPEEIGSATEVPAPLSGNLNVAGRSITAGVREYAPPAGVDGHFVAFETPAAGDDVLRFLSRTAEGEVPPIGR